MRRLYLFLILLSFPLFAVESNVVKNDSIVKKEAHAMFLKGYKFFASNQSDSAFDLFDSLQVYVDEEQFSETAVHYRALSAAVCGKFGFFKESLSKLNEAEALAKLHLDSLNVEWGVVYGNYAFYYNILGIEDKALEFMNKAQVVLRVHKRTQAKVLIGNTFNLASKANEKNDFKKVKELYDEIEEYLPFLEKNQTTSQIKYYTRKAKYFIATGRGLEGKILLEKAISIMDKHAITGFRNLKLKHDLLAFYYYKIGKREEEIYHREQLDSLYRNEVVNIGIVANYHNLAMAYEETNQLEKALETHNSALRLQSELGDLNYYDLLSYLSKVSVLQKMGRLEEALVLCEFALQFASKEGLKNVHGYNLFFALKAAIVSDLGEDFEEVDKIYRQYIQLTDSTYAMSSLTRAKAYFEYGGFLFDNGKYEACLNQIEKGINANQIVDLSAHYQNERKHLWSPKYEYKLRNLKAIALSKLREGNSKPYTLKNQLGVMNEALLSLRSYISSCDHMDQKMALFPALDSLSSEIIDLAYSLKVTDDQDLLTLAWSVAENAHAVLLQENISLYNSYKKIGVSDSIINLLKNKQGEIEGYRALLVDDPSDSIYDVLTSKIVSFEQYKIELESKFPNLNNARKYFESIDLLALQSKLRDKELIISYFISKQYLYTFYASNTDKGWLRKEFNLKNFEQDIVELRASIVQSDLTSFSDNAYVVYSHLLKPLESLTNGMDLIIVPHGILNTISFDCLISKPRDSGSSFKSLSYLVKEKQLEYTHGVRMFYDDYNLVENSIPYLGVAPDYNPDKFSILKWAESEVSTTAKMFNGKVLNNDNASERIVRKNLKEAGILHFASHAELDKKNAYHAKLILTQTSDSIFDDKLYAYELLNLPIEANLVVLNACSSGAGELNYTEGVMSLGRSFTYAGANSVITNLWDVSDKHTFDLLNSFFHEFKDRYTGVEAMRRAKLSYLNSADQLTSAPMFWAAPVLIGRPELVESSTGWISYVVIGFLFSFFVVLSLNKARQRKSKE